MAVALAKAALSRPEELAEIALAGQKLAQENHTWEVRMREMLAYVEIVRDSRSEKSGT